jgi:hypothetical protein
MIETRYRWRSDWPPTVHCTTTIWCSGEAKRFKGGSSPKGKIAFPCRSSIETASKPACRLAKLSHPLVEQRLAKRLDRAIFASGTGRSWVGSAKGEVAMRTLILLSAGLVAVGTTTSPAAAAAATAAAAKPKTADACDAKYYSYLLGSDIGETRSITGTDYRLLPAGGARTATKANRLTFLYDKRSNRIVDVACG